MSDVKSTLEERGSRYGNFLAHAEVTQAFKKLLYRELAVRFKLLPPIQQEALDMIFHKIGRIVNGDNNYDDNWHDIAGYAELVVKNLNGKNI